MSKIYDLIIIGAGAAGLFCAANLNCDCVIVEKNSEAAKKIYATGNGRCNFLNLDADEDSACYNQPEFVSRAMDLCNVEDLLQVFLAMGICPKEDGETGRVYPRSGEAASFAHTLIQAASCADIRYNFEAKTAEKRQGIFYVVSADGQEVKGKKLLITTGGKAGIQFGSDGRGHKLAAAFGHHIVKPVPALAPMTCEEDISMMAGVRCEAMLQLIKHSEKRDEVLAYDYLGEVQFTKAAISGICVMDLSREIRLEEGVSYVLTVNPFWDLDGDKTEEMMQYFPLENLMPAKMAAYYRKYGNFDFHITGTKGWTDAQTTAGGVDVSEIDPGTMESKLCPGLYFAGEVIDVDGSCGGFNLTWAFISALIAAEAIDVPFM